MKKKEYIEPTIQAFEIKTSGMIALSIKDVGNSGAGDIGYIGGSDDAASVRGFGDWDDEWE